MSEPTRTNIPDPDHPTATLGPTADGEVGPRGAPAGYELQALIGRGGMGVVYRARELALARDVAVKILQDRFGPTSAAAARFLDEARITGQLQHPGIPPIHHVGTLPDGRPFLAMKLIKGQTLDSLLNEQAAPAARQGGFLSPFEQAVHASLDRLEEHLRRGRLLAIFEQVCQAVGYAHARDVIHRDLKPANVMVGAFGEVQVMDWGLAKILGESQPQEVRPDAATIGTEIRSLRDGEATQAGSLLGTPAYMPPEQAIGAVDQIDKRSDVFGLGGILAAVLTSRPPFQGETAESTRHLAARGKVQDCFARLDGCGADPELVALCKRCLAPEPEDRPADAGAVARAVADLRAAADERVRQAELERAQAEARAGEQAKRRRLTVRAAGAVAVVLLLGIGGTTWGLLRANHAWDLAEAKRTEAEGERDEKEKARAAEEAAKKRAIDAQSLTEQKRQEAEAAREVATQQRRLALDTVRDVLLRVDDLMKNDARLAPLRIEIIR